MFGMGFGEIVVILVIALLVFGPERLPTMLKEAASFVRDLRAMVARARSDLGDSVADLGLDKEDLELLRDLRNPKSFIRQKVLEGEDFGLNDPELAQALSLDETPARKPKSARKSAVSAAKPKPPAVAASSATAGGETPSPNGVAVASVAAAVAGTDLAASTGSSDETPSSADHDAPSAGDAAPPPFDPDAT